MFLSLYIQVIIVINCVIYSYNLNIKTKIIQYYHNHQQQQQDKHYQQSQQYQHHQQYCLYTSNNDYIDIEISKDNNNNMIISNMSDVSITAIDNYNNNISNIDSSSDMSRSNNKIDIIDMTMNNNNSTIITTTSTYLSTKATKLTTTTSSTSAPATPTITTTTTAAATVTPFQSLQQIGLNITSEIINRINIPHHSITSNNIFCNIELNMEQIKAIGFDMDFTLAQYTIEFDLLAYNGAIHKLIHYHNYPSLLSTDLQYQRDISRRGCMIDKKRGNILKLDQHRYVRAVEHGLTPLSREERKSIYRESYQVMIDATDIAVDATDIAVDVVTYIATVITIFATYYHHIDHNHYHHTYY